MAGVIFTLTIVALGLAVAAFLIGFHIGKGVGLTRKREVKAAREQLANLSGQLSHIESLAMENPDSFVMSLDILRVTRRPTGLKINPTFDQN